MKEKKIKYCKKGETHVNKNFAFSTTSLIEATLLESIIVVERIEVGNGQSNYKPEYHPMTKFMVRNDDGSISIIYPNQIVEYT